MKNLIEQITRLLRIIRVTLIRKVIHVSRKIILPGFEGVSVWEILFFFVWSIRRGLVATRASALAFHFFLAMIPFGLVMVIITAYIPYFDIQSDVLPVFGSFIPESIFSQFVNNIDAFQNSTVNSLISYGFILALYFSSNGFSVLIQSFNSSKVSFEKRNWWSTKITAIGFVFVIIVGVIFLVVVALLERKLLNYWSEHSLFINGNADLIFSIATALFVAVMLYFAIATIYYFGPSKRKEFKFFSAGGTLATALIILTSELYSFYIQKFANYDEFYGSLGTIMMLLLWIYIISFVLLLGFELNASIHCAVRKKRLDHLEHIEERNEEGI
ncbi:MAG: YihY/virulence factor BrkB family protein [Crocinitomix sp.]|nr:YihY/virulence factor BrkB family protein [Crocinitomix sp.]